jgi:hypothetical protein
VRGPRRRKTRGLLRELPVPVKPVEGALLRLLP